MRVRRMDINAIRTRWPTEDRDAYAHSAIPSAASTVFGERPHDANLKCDTMELPLEGAQGDTTWPQSKVQKACDDWSIKQSNGKL